MKFLSLTIVVFLTITTTSCTFTEMFSKKDRAIKKQQLEVKVLGDSRKSISVSNVSILEQDVTLNASDQKLKTIISLLLPGWEIKISHELENIIIDVVIQTNRKEAIFDVLRQVKAQVIFYDAIKPQPVAVIYAN